ncbi:MAG: cytochrome P450 [Anaerolineae bacterium]|nr:cytochrome P450 [Anaerolineae bacterium]
MTHAIPLVPGAPLLGNVLGLTRDAIQFMVAAYHRHGPVYRIRVPGREIIILAGLEANQLLAQSGEEYFRLRPIYGKLVEETASDLYLPTLDEPAYSYYRKLIRPRLSRDTLAGYMPQAVRLIQETAAGWQPGGEVRVMETMTRLCLEIVIRAAENTEVGDELADIVYFTNRLIGSGVAFQPAFLLKLPSYKNAKKRFEAFLQRIVDDHRDRAARGEADDDLVDLLINAKTMDGNPLEGHDLLAYVHLPFVNGVAYSPRLLGYLLYELLRQPELLAAVQQEVDAAFARGPLDLGALRGMRTLYGACMEVLRMYPIAGALPRCVAKPLDFAGCTIPAGRLVFVATGVTHFLPEVYRDPYTFDIARFFEPRSEHQRSGAFAPYGLGGRTCLSAGMGEALIMTVMATLVHAARLELLTPDYRLVSKVAPIPGPDLGFKVRALGARAG